VSDQLDIESQLLLYLAGELPEAERARLEGLLGQDASLRGQLATLSVAKECADSALQVVEEAHPIADARLDAAVRQTSRAIRQWQVDRLSFRHAPPRSRMPRLDWRAYAGAVAASIIVLIGVTVWWQMTSNPAESVPAQFAVNDDDSGEDLATTIEQTMLPPAARNPDIDDVEQQMDNLTYLAGLSRTGKVDLETQ